MAAEHEGVHVLDADAEFPRKEGGEARRVQHTGHADDLVGGEARKFAKRPDHRVQRIGDADHESVRRVVADAFADRLHHLEVDAEQIVAAHAGLARHARGDDHDISAGDVGIVVRTGDCSVEAFDRAALAEVERLALRNALGHVEENDVAKALQCREVGERAADVAGADEGDLLAGHIWTSFPDPSGRS